MLTRLTNWIRKRQTARIASEAAWGEEIVTGPDGLTGFERDAVAAIETLAGRLSIERSGRLDKPTLSARIPNCDLVMTLWGEDAQLHTANGQSVYRKERWDFSTPQESVADLTNSVASHLRTENKK
jgi:hypothetical protein